MNIGYRINNETEAYLLQVAKENHLNNPSNNEPSAGIAAKEIIKWCMKNNINISKNLNELSSETVKMIEQIHVAIPHLMLLTRMNTQEILNLSEEKVTEVRAKSLNYLNKTCGSFQDIHYENVRVTINSAVMKQAPSTDLEGVNSWK